MRKVSGAGEVDVLLVTVGGERFGVPAEQIAGLAALGPCPAAASPPGTSLATLLGLPPAPIETRCVTLRSGRTFRVDAVGDLVRLSLSSVRRLPPLLRDPERGRFAAALQGEQPPLLLLDLDRLKGTDAC